MGFSLLGFCIGLTLYTCMGILEIIFSYSRAQDKLKFLQRRTGKFHVNLVPNGKKKKLSTRWTNASRTSPSSGQHLEISWLIILRAPLLGSLQASLVNVSQILWWDSGLTPWGMGHLLLLLVALSKPPHLRKQFWENHLQREGLDISCWSKTAPQSTLLCLWANVGGCALWRVCLQSRRQDF